MTADRDSNQLERQFTTLVAAWLFTHRSGSTRAAYGADLAHFAAWCANSGRVPLRVDDREVARYRDDCGAAGASPATVSRRLSALASFYRHAEDADEVDTNPTDNVARPDTYESSSTDELDESERRALVAAAGDVNLKAAALVDLLLLDGVKLGEALRADVADLTSPPPALTVGRRGRLQSVILCAATVATIDAYLRTRTTGPLFLSDTPGRERQRLTRAGAHYLLKRASAHAGLTKTISANTLRRSYVANAHHAGVPLDDIQVAVGHDDRRTTRRLLPHNTNSPNTADPKEAAEC
jgi:integrase/recombinase XerD